jgi:NAD(P)-dependent dehydrogenase (short-subunit alcohol dehydrogenase family)
MQELAGKTAFVTGGASGIGFTLGRALAEVGMKVTLADIETDALTVALARSARTSSTCSRIPARVGAPSWQSGLPPSWWRWTRRRLARGGGRRGSACSAAMAGGTQLQVVGRPFSDHRGPPDPLLAGN